MTEESLKCKTNLTSHSNIGLCVQVSQHVLCNCIDLLFACLANSVYFQTCRFLGHISFGLARFLRDNFQAQELHF